MTTKNPFPGMNPFFDQCWHDAHTRLIGYACDALHERLPADLVARCEEGVGALVSAERTRMYRPDIKIKPWNLKEGGMAAAPEPPIEAAAPIRVLRDEETERWIEIREASGRVISAIELLSPANKQGASRDDYLRKRRGFISGGINLVEIDLVRPGASVFSDRVRETLKRAGAFYGVCVFRAAQPVADEVYPIRMRERLPAIRIPLRESDPDVVLDLQPLINQCHERGRYHTLDYSADPEPPLSPDDASWMDRLLRDAGLRR